MRHTNRRTLNILGGVMLLVTLLVATGATGRGVDAVTREKGPGPAGLTPAEWARIANQLPIPVQEAKLTTTDAQSGDFFGNGVALDGDTIVVGAHGVSAGSLWHAGAAYIFERNQGGINNWGQVKKLTAGDPGFGDQFGQTVAISGDTIAVGAPYENGGSGNPLPDAGAVYIFQRDQGGPNNWGQVKKVTPEDPGEEDDFGLAIDLEGDTLVAASPGEDGGPGDPLSYAGAVYVFARHQGGMDHWGQVKKLMASDADAGDGLGNGVAISGDTLVAGAPSEDGGPGDPLVWAGAAYLFERHQGGMDNWGEVTKLGASDPGMNDRFGQAMAIDGDTLVVGAPHEDGGPGDPLFVAGAAYVFGRNEGGPQNWGEVVKLSAADRDEGDLFAGHVAIREDTILAGAANESGGPGDPLQNAGAVYVFTRDQGEAGGWNQVAKLMAGDAHADDYFGGAVALGHNGIILAGAANGDADGPPTVLNSGAAYAFCLDDDLEENDDFAQATAILPGSLPDLQVCGGDDDFFALALQENDILDVTINFHHAAGNLDLALFDADQYLLAISESQTDNEHLNVQVSAEGDYFIRVFGFEGALAGYSLQTAVEAGESMVFHYLPIMPGP